MKIGLVDSGIGVIPFIKEIIKQQKNNQYYIFLDLENFPYGEKNEDELFKILKKIFNYYEKLNIDLLIICCNTLSNIYLNEKIFSSFKVITILEINKSHKKKMLTTSQLASSIGSIDGKNLASIIQNNQTLDIIKYIKNFNENDIILSCTHYPLIKLLFEHYGINIYSYENEIIKTLPTNGKMNFFCDSKSFHIIRQFFPKLSINLLT